MKTVTNRIKLFIFDPLWEDLTNEEQIRSLKEAGYDIRVYLEPRPLKSIQDLYEGLEPRVIAINPDFINWKLKIEDYADIPNLKGIFVASTAFEWIERDLAKERDIPISNIVDFSTEAVAEWAILMMLSLARQTPKLIKNGFPLDFDKDFYKYRGIQLKGKTAGIIGLGHIGSAIAERCIGLGMNVIYYSKSSRNVDYKYYELEDLLKNADVIFPTLAKNQSTTKLLGGNKIENVKETSIIVDISHGLINHKLAIDMIEQGHLFGYGFEAEPNSFIKFPGNIWAAPAYAWATNTSMLNSETKLIEDLLDATKNNYPNKINK